MQIAMDGASATPASSMPVVKSLASKKDEGKNSIAKIGPGNADVHRSIAVRRFTRPDSSQAKHRPSGGGLTVCKIPWGFRKVGDRRTCVIRPGDEEKDR